MENPPSDVAPDVRNTPPQRTVGTAAGHFVVPADFGDPLPDDIPAAFEGRRVEWF